MASASVYPRCGLRCLCRCCRSCSSRRGGCCSRSCSCSCRCSTRRRRWCWCWTHTAGQRINIGAATARPDRERGGAAVDLHVPHHRVRDTVLKAQPGWRRYRYVVGIVNAPVCPSVNLVGIVRINNDRIHRNIRQIAGLVYPCEGAAVSSAGYLKNMTRRARRVRIKAAYCRVAHG